MKAYPANGSIIRKTIKFPSGKEISLGSTCMKHYIVTSKEELDFLSKQRDIQLIVPDVKEIIAYLEKLPDVPTVNSNVDSEKAKEFCLSEIEEESLKDELIKRGYSISKFSGNDEKASVVQKISNTALIKEFSRRSKIDKSILSAIQVEANEVPNELVNMSFQEIKQLMAKLGYDGLRETKKKKEI
jgi:hypothetical protein